MVVVNFTTITKATELLVSLFSSVCQYLDSWWSQTILWPIPEELHTGPKKLQTPVQKTNNKIET